MNPFLGDARSDSAVFFSAFLEQSEHVEPYIWIASLLFALLLGLNYYRRKKSHSTPAKHYHDLGPKSGKLCLGAIIVGATVLRLVDINPGPTGFFYGSTNEILRAYYFVHSQNPFSSWLASLANTGAAGWTFDSPFLRPIVAVLVVLFGEQPWIAAVFGYVFSLITLSLIYWLVRETYGSRTAALCAAAFFAVSPLEVTWSRLGFRVVAALPHVLAITLVGLHIGKTGRLRWAFPLGFLAFACVYNHDTARIGLPMVYLAILCGSILASKSSKQTCLLFAKASLLITCGLALPVLLLGQSFLQAFWPLTDDFRRQQLPFLESLSISAQQAWQNALQVAKDLFIENRFPGHEISGFFGVESGGLLLAPVALLGVSGFLLSLKKWRKTLCWYFLLGLGALVPILSCSQPRRLLIVECAWIVFAAYALTTILYLCSQAGVRRSLRICSAGSFFLSLGAWSILAIYSLQASSNTFVELVPFGSAGPTCQMDVLYWPGSSEVIQQFEKDFADRKIVVQFDRDIWRENSTAPAGLPILQQLLALRHQAEDRLFNFYYEVSSGWKFDSFVPPPNDEPSALRLMANLRSLASESAISWYFLRPNAWEMSFYEALVELGGVKQHFIPQLHRSTSVKVTTTPDQLTDALTELERRLAVLPDSAEKAGCEVADVEVESLPLRGSLLDFILPDAQSPFCPGGVAVLHEQNIISCIDPPKVLSVANASANLIAIDSWSPSRVDGTSSNRESVQMAETPAGLEMTSRKPLLPSNPLYRDRENSLFLITLAPSCVWRCADATLALNMLSGTLDGAPWDLDWLPNKRWVGGVCNEHELILAAADGTLVVGDYGKRAVQHVFSVSTLPEISAPLGRCLPIATLGSKIVVFDARHDALSFMSRDGKLEYQHRSIFTSNIVRLRSRGDELWFARPWEIIRLKLPNHLTCAPNPNG